MRTLRALELLSQAPRKLEELATELGVHRRTAARMMSSFIGAGYAKQAEGDHKFSATLKSLELAGYVIERTSLVATAFPFVTKVRNISREAAHLSIPSTDGAMHIIQETAESIVMVKPRVGEIVPYHCTAVGKALLAFNPEIARRILSKDLKRYTKYTTTDSKQLREELNMILLSGLAHDVMENSLELRCVAAPVSDSSGAVVGAIGISAPVARFTEERVASVAGELLEIANQLTAELGGSLPTHAVTHPQTAVRAAP